MFVYKTFLDNIPVPIEYVALATPGLGQSLMGLHFILEIYQHINFYITENNQEGFHFGIRARHFLQIANPCLIVQAIAAVALAILFPQPITFVYAATCGASLIALLLANNSPLLPPENMAWLSGFRD